MNYNQMLLSLKLQPSRTLIHYWTLSRAIYPLEILYLGFKVEVLVGSLRKCKVHFVQYRRKPLIWFWNEAFKRGLKQNCWIHGTFCSRPISTLKRWFRPPSPPPPVRRSLTEGTACRLLGSQSCQKSVIHFETVCTSDLSGLSLAIILQTTTAKYHNVIQKDWFTVTCLYILAMQIENLFKKQLP